jgi:hypothetical protein
VSLQPQGHTLANKTLRRLVHKHQITNSTSSREEIEKYFNELLGRYHTDDSTKEWKVTPHDELSLLILRNIQVTASEDCKPADLNGSACRPTYQTAAPNFDHTTQSSQTRRRMTIFYLWWKPACSVPILSGGSSQRGGGRGGGGRHGRGGRSWGGDDPGALHRWGREAREDGSLAR